MCQISVVLVLLRQLRHLGGDGQQATEVLDEKLEERLDMLGDTKSKEEGSKGKKERGLTLREIPPYKREKAQRVFNTHYTFMIHHEHATQVSQFEILGLKVRPVKRNKSTDERKMRQARFCKMSKPRKSSRRGKDTS